MFVEGELVPPASYFLNLYLSFPILRDYGITSACELLFAFELNIALKDSNKLLKVYWYDIYYCLTRFKV